MKKSIVAALCMLIVAGGQAVAQHVADYPVSGKGWAQLLKDVQPDFLHSADGRRIARNVLDYQRVTGGWPKNVPMHKVLTDDERKLILLEKYKINDSTTDNNATIQEMDFLAKMYAADSLPDYKDAFMKGMDYLLGGQYENGGWPQFWPKNRGYQVHITYNDNAMVRIMNLLKKVRDRKEHYTLVDDTAMLARVSQAFDKGVECILNTQIMVDGQPTVWCQQHDYQTLEPCKARAYELPSFCSSESVALVMLLMDIRRPSERVKASVRGAMKWLDAHKLQGIRVEKFTNAGGKKDIRVVDDKNARPIWARYYDLHTQQPYFCDRDGIERSSLDEIGYERRNGYGWYNYAAEKAFQKYKKWAAQNGE